VVLQPSILMLILLMMPELTDIPDTSVLSVLI
jgi:hypothetical protein